MFDLIECNETALTMAVCGNPVHKWVFRLKENFSYILVTRPESKGPTLNRPLLFLNVESFLISSFGIVLPLDSVYFHWLSMFLP